MSWEQLKAILEANKQDHEAYLQEEIDVCPICGDLLDSNSAGVKNCPMGHYTNRGEPRQ